MNPSGNDPVTIPCPVCATPFTPAGKRRYCRDACRVAAHRRRTRTRTRTRRPARPAPAAPAHHRLRMRQLRDPPARHPAMRPMRHLHAPRRARRALPPLRRTRHHRRTPQPLKPPLPPGPAIRHNHPRRHAPHPGQKPNHRASTKPRALQFGTELSGGGCSNCADGYRPALAGTRRRTLGFPDGQG
jgi:hypothetical protein